MIVTRLRTSILPAHLAHAGTCALPESPAHAAHSSHPPAPKAPRHLPSRSHPPHPPVAFATDCPRTCAFPGCALRLRDGIGSAKAVGSAVYWAGVFIFVSGLLLGCGYQFRVQGSGPTVGGADAGATKAGPPPRMAIRTFENRTFEANLEIKITNYMRREFSGGTGTQIVGESEPADLLMTGQVLGILLPTLSFDQTTTFENRVELLISVKIQEMRTKRVVWTQVIKGQSEFFITGDLQFNRVLQNRALEQASRFAAEDVASRYLVYLESGQLEAAMRRTEPQSKADRTNAVSSRRDEPAN